MRLASIICALLLISGCTTLDSALTDMGVIEEQTSKFDSVRRVVMSPAITNHGMDTHAEFGLRWDSTMGDYALLELMLPGVGAYDFKKPLELLVDGEKMVLPAAFMFDFGTIIPKHDEVVGDYHITLKDYVISKEQIKQIFDAEEAHYRIYLTRNGVFEGEVNYDYRGYQSYVVGAFEKFYNYIWQI